MWRLHSDWSLGNNFNDPKILLPYPSMQSIMASVGSASLESVCFYLWPSLSSWYHHPLPHYLLSSTLPLGLNISLFFCFFFSALVERLFFHLQDMSMKLYWIHSRSSLKIFNKQMAKWMDISDHLVCKYLGQFEASLYFICLKFRQPLFHTKQRSIRIKQRV